MRLSSGRPRSSCPTRNDRNQPIGEASDCLRQSRREILARLGSVTCELFLLHRQLRGYESLLWGQTEWEIAQSRISDYRSKERIAEIEPASVETPSGAHAERDHIWITRGFPTGCVSSEPGASSIPRRNIRCIHPGLPVAILPQFLDNLGMANDPSRRSVDTRWTLE